MNSVLLSQIARYGVIGIVATLIHICVASLFVCFILESLFIANGVAFVFAFVFSYPAQSKFVFISSITFKKAAKFFIVQLTSLFLAVQLAQLAETISIYLKILIVAFLLPICAFGIHRVWTFVDYSGPTNPNKD
jgi:putative flippase GtrA